MSSRAKPWRLPCDTKPWSVDLRLDPRAADAASMARMIASWLVPAAPPKTPEWPLLNPEGGPTKAPPPLLLVVLPLSTPPAPPPDNPRLLLPSREGSLQLLRCRLGPCADSAAGSKPPETWSIIASSKVPTSFDPLRL
jgi:hypothetical protein